MIPIDKTKSRSKFYIVEFVLNTRRSGIGP